MANLLFDYTVLDQGYTHGKLQFITGDDGAPAANVNNPADTRINDIDPYTDMDPEIFSYMDGTTPRALLCNVTTPLTPVPPPPTSTGKYTVCTPTAPVPPATAWTWAITGPKDIGLKDGNDDVAGNPYGVVRVGDFLYIVQYDSAKIYWVNAANFQAATAATYPVDGSIDASPDFVNPPATDYYAHGAAILSMTDSTGTYIYGLFTVAENNASGYPSVYTASALVRYTVDPNTGDLVKPFATEVGLNATALVPVSSVSTTTTPDTILVPAIGGTQQYGTTNGVASSLSVVGAFGGFPIGATAPIAFTGDAAGPVTPTGAYDIKGAAASEDGAYAYVLTATNTGGYLTNWRLYQTTVAAIIGVAGSPLTLSAAVTAGTLTAIDSTANPSSGDDGYYWEVQYENNATAANGRLWFVKGSPIRISLGSDYTTPKLIDAGSGGPLYSPAFNVNSGDLIAETIYAATQGVSKDTRLIKGSSAAQTAAAAAAASDEEEEK